MISHIFLGSYQIKNTFWANKFLVLNIIITEIWLSLILFHFLVIIANWEIWQPPLIWKNPLNKINLLASEIKPPLKHVYIFGVQFFSRQWAQKFVCRTEGIHEMIRIHMAQWIITKEESIAKLPSKNRFDVYLFRVRLKFEF